MLDFTEPIVQRGDGAPSPVTAASAAAISIRSPRSVAVPCISRYCAAVGSSPAAAQASTIAAVCPSTLGAA